MCIRDSYSPEHIAKLCRNKRHQTSLHSWRPERKNGQYKESETGKEDQAINVCTTVCNVTEAGDVPITMGIVPIWLYHKNNPNNRICVYALLDNASGGTYIKEDSLRKFGMERVESKLLLTTVDGTQEIETKAVDGLMASHFEKNDVSLALPRNYARE